MISFGLNDVLITSKFLHHNLSHEGLKVFIEIEELNDKKAISSWILAPLVHNFITSKTAECNKFLYLRGFGALFLAF